VLSHPDRKKRGQDGGTLGSTLEGRINNVHPVNTLNGSGSARKDFQVFSIYKSGIA
jgi:hypothetical protein